jgi:murein DD-endopeptidase MepM/ murein hydrolase activator NlpD
MERSRHTEGLLILLALILLGGIYLWQNNQPAMTVSIPAATTTPLDTPLPEWQTALETQLAATTPIPTPDMGIATFVPPTLPPSQTAGAILIPTQIQSTLFWTTPTFQPTAQVRPTGLGPAPLPSPTGIFEQDSGGSADFQPPPEQVPLSPHADDHFWLMRPVDASANSASLFYYPFGSDGPRDEWRVHHGVDMPNPVGESIRAGGAGTVIWAGNAAEAVDAGENELYASYGNVVIIKHDFGYRGQNLWTLYAHMSAVLVQQGQHVEAGDVIGLSGGTGDVSGPHVHLEVRMGKDDYFHVYNPLLWIAPYVGHGVIAGRVSSSTGDYIDDAVVTLSQHGRVVETTTTYVQPYVPESKSWHVMPDPAWHENFVLGDIPEGDYEISVMIGGIRLARTISVKAGTTNFVTLGTEPAATPQPVATGS